MQTNQIHNCKKLKILILTYLLLNSKQIKFKSQDNKKMKQYQRSERLSQNNITRGTVNNNKKSVDGVINDSKSTQSRTTGNNNHNYYSIQGQVAQYAESRIVSQRNSIMMSNINYSNHNKPNAFQLFSQQTAIAQNNHIQNNPSLQSTQTYKRHQQRTNKLQVISDNQSSVNNNKNVQSLINNNNRSSSINRGGIRVVSRNSTLQKKSQTSSVEKSNTDVVKVSGNSKDKDTGLGGILGLNCKTRSPFIQAQQHNELTIVPNLGSIQNSQMIIDNKALSDRQSYRLNNAKDNNNNKIGSQPQVVYKQLRELMQKQVMVSRKMYEKKCIDEVESINIIYQSQIETLQKVLAENQTLIQQQDRKIQRLQQKCNKQHQRINIYTQRLQSITKYIHSTNKFALQRLNQAQLKLTILLSDFHQLNPTQHQSSLFTSKLQHLQTIFTTLIAQTMMRYRNIQLQIKEQIKDVIKKYDYFEEKIYQMDLMKHLGKENQIQNYKLIEKISTIKEHLAELQSIKQQQIIKPEYNKVSNQSAIYDSEMIKDLQQFNEVKTTVYRLQAQVGFWEKNQNQTFTKINKLEVDKYRLVNKISQLNDELMNRKQQVEKIRMQNQALKKEIKGQKEYNYSEQKGYQPQSAGKQLIQQQCLQEKYQFSSDKKSINSNGEQQQLIDRVNNTSKKEIQRLHQIIDQYECKIEQLHSAVQELQTENGKLVNELNKKTLQEKKQSLTMDQSTIMKLNHLIQEKESNIIKLNFIIDEKQIQLQQTYSKLQQTQNNFEEVTRQRDQLNQALQMTQQIFDGQISKFKQTISRLQDENQQLLYQLNQFRELSSQNNMEKSSTSFLSRHSNIGQNKKVAISKSSKKEMCETVTMGWFKKNVQENQISNNNGQKVFYREVQSPTNNYTSQQQQQHYQQHSSGQKDEFFYPLQNYHSYSQSILKSIDTSRSSNSNTQSHHQQQHQMNHVRHSHSLPNGNNYSYGYKQNNNRNQQNVNMNINRLHQALIEGNYNCPIECILDNEGRLQQSNTGKYIVDRNYTTFHLSQQQLSLAHKLKLINLIDENNQPNDNQQQQGEHYIF